MTVCEGQSLKDQRRAGGPQAISEPTCCSAAPRKLTPHQAREALKRVEADEPLREVALSYAVNHSSISRLKARCAAEA